MTLTAFKCRWHGTELRAPLFNTGIKWVEGSRARPVISRKPHHVVVGICFNEECFEYNPPTHLPLLLFHPPPFASPPRTLILLCSQDVLMLYKSFNCMHDDDDAAAAVAAAAPEIQLHSHLIGCVVQPVPLTRYVCLQPTISMNRNRISVSIQSIFSSKRWHGTCQPGGGWIGYWEISRYLITYIVGDWFGFIHAFSANNNGKRTN